MKRPNPAVANITRSAQTTDTMAKIANDTKPGSSTATNLRNLADRRKTTASKMSKSNPYLISNE